MTIFIVILFIYFPFAVSFLQRRIKRKHSHFCTCIIYCFAYRILELGIESLIFIIGEHSFISVIYQFVLYPSKPFILSLAYPTDVGTCRKQSSWNICSVFCIHLHGKRFLSFCVRILWENNADSKS